MADQLVAATVKVLLEKAVSVAADRVGLMLGIGFHKDLKALQEHAKDIQAVLADAENKQLQNPIVLRWLHKVEAAAIEADYVLDELLYESLRRKVESRRAAKVCQFFSSSKHDLSFRWRIGSKVREINGIFKKFILEVPGIGLIRMEDSMSLIGTMATTEVVTGRETNSLPLPFVAGRVKEVSEIVGMLSSEASASISVFSIVGMGGLGKTTLAKSVYNNPRIASHFGRKIWVCVSDKFEVTELFRLVLESLKGKKVEKFGQDAIVRKIQEELEGKRFVLVLDDVWIQDQKLWDDFYTSLVGLNTTSGSCCLVTTRLQKTANLVSTFTPYVLGKLTDDECWYILCRRATKDGEMPQQLDVHREQILKRCKGLPLAANAVGGLLSLQKREEWPSFVEKKILNVGEYVEGDVMPILRLSFDNLPSLSIKKCFAYFSMYSKDERINGKQLVEFWMAEGFLQEDVERRTMMEEVGDDYLTILLQCSLLEKVHDGDKMTLGNDSYQMHDLVHDLAESISKQEQIDGECNYQHVRHLALALNSGGYGYNTRSTLVRFMEGDISNEVLLKFKGLYLLVLFGRRTKDSLNVIGNLKHLRFLDISVYEITVLPESLCKLYNLQTLILDGCPSLQCLPRGLSNLISLRNLHFHRNDCKLKMPPNIGRLTCLQTLTFFNVGGEKGGEIEELGFMRNLTGNVEIRNLELVKGKEGARLANLFDKHKLVWLKLCWSSTDGHDNDEHVLEGLQPHPNLQTLSIRNYMGVRFPQWFGKLTALSKLIFNNCKKCKDLPTLGNLPNLEHLSMDGLEQVVCMGNSFYFEGLREGKMFPSLKHMMLKNMPNLKEWMELEAENGHVFSKLEYLHICDCCQLANVPTSFPSLKTLIIEGNIQVSVVRDIVGKSCLLKNLIIRYMSGLNSFADVTKNHLTCLEQFEISDCDNLIDIPSSIFEYYTSLKMLEVVNCPNLMPCAMNFQGTPSLSFLWFSRCPKMFTTNIMATGFDYLTSLRDLSIGPFTDETIELFDWSGLVQACSSTIRMMHWCGSLQKHSSLPQQLQHLASLALLNLSGLRYMKTLPDWLGNLTSLRRLELNDCPKLQDLPSAQAMRNLTSLDIHLCPLLPQSSNLDISSLPNLKIYRL